jgi:hypothetical protein
MIVSSHIEFKKKTNNTRSICIDEGTINLLKTKNKNKRPLGMFKKIVDQKSFASCKTLDKHQHH